MQRFLHIGTLILLVFGALFISTYSIFYDNESIELANQEGLSGEISIRVPMQVFTGQQAKVSVSLLLDKVYGNEFPSLIDARYETNLNVIDPIGNLRFTVIQEKPLKITWVIRPDQPGTWQGTLWLNSIGASNNGLLLAREVTITSRNFLFTRVENIRIPCGLLMGVGVIILLFGLNKRDKTQP
jgi:hypothetical protein